MIRIFGSSDDRIEVEGDVEGEFQHNTDSDNRTLLATSNGIVIRWTYTGEWEARIVKQPVGLDVSIFAAGTAKATGVANDYTDLVMIDHNIGWVVAGTEMVSK